MPKLRRSFRKQPRHPARGEGGGEGETSGARLLSENSTPR
jgi:hypothetical protein